jgi:DNA-binding FadR family transcriptional regulator
MVSQLAPVRRTVSSSEGTDPLSGAIRCGEFLLGARLPVEEAQGVQFGVGRTSIHEILRILHATDMVTIRPPDGVVVADHASINDQPLALADWESRYPYRSEELFAACLADGVIK